MGEEQKEPRALKMSKQREETILLQKVFRSRDGKEDLKKISHMCNENEPTYVDHNPNGTAYKEGQRSIIIGIRKMMNKNFDKPKQGKAEIG